MSNIEESQKFKALGNTAFQSGKFEESIEHFTKAIELNPSDHIFYSNRSGSYASLKDYEKALADATKCVEIKPDWAKGYQRKGLAEYFLQKSEEAEATYNQGLSLDPNNKQLQEGLTQVQSQKNGAGAGGMDQFTQQFMMKLMMNPETAGYLQDPEFVQKLSMLQKNPQMFAMHANDPKMQKAMQVMFSDFSMPGGSPFGGAGSPFGGAGAGEEQENQEKDNKFGDGGMFMEEEVPTQKKPEPTFEKKKEEPAKKQEPLKEPHEVEKNLGNDAYKKKDFQAALTHYNKAIELAPNEVLLFNNKAAVYIEMKELDKALETINQAVKVSEDINLRDFTKLGKIYARKGTIHEKLGQYKEAKEFYDKSLLEDQQYSVKQNMLRVDKLFKEEEARAYINPEIAEEHNNKAKGHFQEGKFPDALKEYEEAIKRNPTDAKLYCNKATALIKLMDFVGALKDIEKCLELDPSYVRAYARKGNCHFSMKEYHKAMDAFQKGISLDKENKECKEGLQRVQTAIAFSQGESSETQDERAKHAMADPEIQAILKNPQIMNVLRNMQENPHSAENAKALRDPIIGAQIQKLIAAGILKMG